MKKFKVTGDLTIDLKTINETVIVPVSIIVMAETEDTAVGKVIRQIGGIQIDSKLEVEELSEHEGEANDSTT